MRSIDRYVLELLKEGQLSCSKSLLRGSIHQYIPLRINVASSASLTRAKLITRQLNTRLIYNNGVSIYASNFPGSRIKGESRFAVVEPTYTLNVPLKQYSDPCQHCHFCAPPFLYTPQIRPSSQDYNEAELCLMLYD
jgi:hypothetical protein